MRNTKVDKTPIFKLAIVGLLLVFLVAAALLFVELWEKNHGEFQTASTGSSKVLEYNGKEYVLKDRIETFLMLGLDKYEGTSEADSYNNDKQADFLMLFVFDNEAQTCTAVQINRDTMANVNVLAIDGIKVIDTQTKQIALAHTYGNGQQVSCRNTADSVSDLLLGIKVDHYISFTMDSVAVLNDLVGGVEVTVLEDFADIDATLVKGQKVTLMGEHALTYVRTRQGLEDSSNVSRMKRQQQYVNALYGKLISCIQTDETFALKVAAEMDDYVVYDATDSRMQEFAKKFDSYEFLGIRNIEGESKWGEQFMEFYPSEGAVEKLVIELFYDPKK